jgi:hypothetical protein
MVVPTISCLDPRIRVIRQRPVDHRAVGETNHSHEILIRSGPIRSVDAGDLGSVSRFQFLDSVYIGMLSV